MDVDTANKKTASPVRKALRRLLVHCLLIVVLLIGAFVGVNYLLASYTFHDQEVKVPDLQGLTLIEAVNRLEAVGLRAEVEDSVYIKGRKPGTVYRQSLSQGSRVKANRLIKLTINAALPPTVLLPDLADNCSEREATMKLTVLGMTLGPTVYVNGERDWVYDVKVDGKSVTAGTRIPAESVITLVVGNGSYYDETVEDNESIIYDEPETDRPTPIPL